METTLSSAKVKEYGINAGATVVGIASAKDFEHAPDGFEPTDVLPECRSVVVLAATFPPEVLDDIIEYTASRNAMLTAMTTMAKEVAKKLKAEGYKTKVVSAAAANGCRAMGGKSRSGTFP